MAVATRVERLVDACTVVRDITSSTTAKFSTVSHCGRIVVSAREEAGGEEGERKGVGRGEGEGRKGRKGTGSPVS